MSKQQSAIDHFTNLVIDLIDFSSTKTREKLREAYEEANELFRKQIQEAQRYALRNADNSHAMNGTMQSFYDKYYNETYAHENKID